MAGRNVSGWRFLETECCEDATLRRYPNQLIRHSLMALPLLLPMKLVIVYIEASCLVGLYSLEGEYGELRGGLPRIYI
jgi:hypothetical protein